MYTNTLSYETITAILEENFNLSEISKYLKYSALGARICYNDKPVLELLEKDKKINEKPIEFLKTLASKGHTSVLSHCVKSFDYYGIKTNNFTALLSRIDPDMSHIFSLISEDIIYPCFYFARNPSIQSLLRKNTLKFIKMILRNYLKGIPFTPFTNELTINLRTLYELYKSIGKEDILWNNIIQPELMQEIQILVEHELSTGSRLYILRCERVDDDRQWILTFILENVSKVLTHQLVRHKLDVEYSQRSYRYTRASNSDTFILPTSLQSEMIHDHLTDQLMLYRVLVKENQVKPEDARYILSCGCKTNIMCTMYSKETILNFINLRTSPKAQWEIREVAEIIKSVFEL